IHFWEPTLKGHGIPEAMEAVLVGKSRVRMRVGFLKPIATAFAIGTGGPFGAEGPIIQTGAAFGSILGQFTKLTPYQRRVLLASRVRRLASRHHWVLLPSGIRDRIRHDSRYAQRSFVQRNFGGSLDCQILGAGAVLGLRDDRRRVRSIADCGRGYGSGLCGSP